MRLVALISVLAIATPTTAVADDDERLTVRVLALAGGLALHSTSEYLVKDQLAPDDCRWCAPPGFDRAARDALLWNEPGDARSLSNFTAYVGIPVLGAAVFGAGARGSRCWSRRFVEDALPVAESLIYSQLVTQAFKFTFGRQRPLVRFATTPLEPTNEDNLSFYSGHSSIAFSLAVSSSLVAYRRGYRFAPLLAISTLTLAAATAYLRVAGDSHYLSDVLVGSAAGAAAGYLIPRLTTGRGFTIAPSPGGIALLGTL